MVISVVVVVIMVVIVVVVVVVVVVDGVGVGVVNVVDIVVVVGMIELPPNQKTKRSSKFCFFFPRFFGLIDTLAIFIPIL